MKRIYFFLLFLAVAYIFPSVSLHVEVQAASAAASSNDDGWIVMPAGAKSAYMGIHGGTMPVSLLVSGDGASLFSFVGRTGNDFLNVLREAYLPLPSFGNSTKQSSNRRDLGKIQTGIFAGNATATMPVITLSTDLLTNQNLIRHLQPFGLSEEPLRIEGSVAKPAVLSPIKRYKNIFMPDYFQPRQNRR